VILNLQLFQLLWLILHQRSEIATTGTRLLGTSEALHDWTPIGEGRVRALRDRHLVLGGQVRDV